MATKHQAVSLSWAEVTAGQRQACAELWHAVWPTFDDSRIAGRLARMDTNYGHLRNLQIHMAFDDTCALMAIARTFHHTITIGDKPLEIVALASVCSHPERRGAGWGDVVVQAAFDRVTADGKPALFQSPIPAYYERFGSRTITNTIMTSAVGARAFHEPSAMIHPAGYPWDDTAVIDLRIAGW